MSRRGENIYKRADGRYEGRYVKGRNLDGTTRFGYIYGKQYAEVKKRLIQKKSELSRNSQCSNCSVSLSEWVYRWQVLNLRSRVKPSTEQTYYVILKNYILPMFGDYDLGAITTEKVLELISHMNKKGYSEGTVLSMLRLLSAIMNAAVDNELIKHNPCKKIGITKIYHRKEQRVLSREEQTLLEKSEEISILIALYTGMRIGEICGLKWSDIDWETNTITVQRTVQRVKLADGTTRLVENTPKTNSSYRMIPLADALREKLITLSNNDNVYILGKENSACDPRSLQRKLKKITSQYGITNIHFHSLRHTFATRMLGAGIDIKTISILLGHSSVNTTMDIYTHSSMELKKAAIKKAFSIEIHKPS